MQFLYISNGNIPSRWAHTIQTMKMAEAFTRLALGFRLLIASDYRSYLHREPSLRAWYGLTTTPRLRRIRWKWTLDEAERLAVNWREFNAYAIAYAAGAQPDLVMTRSYPIGLACLEYGLEVIFETHAGPGHAKLPLIEAMASRAGLRGMVTIAEPLAELYRDLGVAPEKILVWPDAVDLARFGETGDREAARVALGIPKERTVVAYTGHLYEHKGVGTLLAAAESLPEVLFLLVGGWPKDVEQWRSRYGDEKNVRFEGFVVNAAVPGYLAAADMCVLPNAASDGAATYTSPLKLFEYMASHRPVIASDIPAVHSILRHAENALIVPADDSAALADAITHLQSDPATASRLAAAARSDVEHYTWTNRARAILEQFAPEFLRR